PYGFSWDYQCPLLGYSARRYNPPVRNDGLNEAGRASRPAFMNDVTQLLGAIGQGDPHAAGRLLPLVYDELRRLPARKLARARAGQTLQPTALVHEAYLRLVGTGDGPHWDSRGHFFAAAAEAMRRILVEKARRKRRLRHGGGWQRVELTDHPA